jgi:hypothetical protein
MKANNDGNPDPAKTNCKGAEKQLELADWHYPKHLAGGIYDYAPNNCRHV